MLNQNCIHNRVLTQPEPKKPRITTITTTTTTDQDLENCSTTSVESQDQGLVSMVKGEEDSGRERLNRHRMEMAGRVWIPEIWGQERFLKDWADCAAFDSSLVPKGVVSARQALVEECRRANSGGLRIENRC